MGEAGAPVDQVQDAPVGDAPAPGQLQPGQQGTVAGDEGEAAVRGPGHPGEAHTGHTRGPHRLDRGAPHQPGQDGPQRSVRGHEGRVTQADVSPEVRLPDQSPQPRAGGAQPREVARAPDVGQDPGQEAVIEGQEVTRGGHVTRSCHACGHVTRV